MAIEVELNLKSEMIYGDVGKFYGTREEISDVVWLLPRAKMANTIAKGLQKGSSKDFHIHNFITIEQFLEHGWQAKFVGGRDPSNCLLKTLANLKLTTPKPVSAMLYLDGSKSPFRSTCPKPIATSEKFN